MEHSFKNRKLFYYGMSYKFIVQIMDKEFFYRILSQAKEWKNEPKIVCRIIVF
jgi:hypothetical protein